MIKHKRVFLLSVLTILLISAIFATSASAYSNQPNLRGHTTYALHVTVLMKPSSFKIPQGGSKEIKAKIINRNSSTFSTTFFFCNLLTSNGSSAGSFNASVSLGVGAGTNKTFDYTFHDGSLSPGNYSADCAFNGHLSGYGNILFQTVGFSPFSFKVK